MTFREWKKETRGLYFGIKTIVWSSAIGVLILDTVIFNVIHLVVFDGLSRVY